MSRFRSRAELRAIFARIQEARAGYGRTRKAKTPKTVPTPAEAETSEALDAQRLLDDFEQKALGFDDHEEGFMISKTTGKMKIGGDARNIEQYWTIRQNILQKAARLGANGRRVHSWELASFRTQVAPRIGREALKESPGGYMTLDLDPGSLSWKVFRSTITRLLRKYAPAGA